MNILVLRFSALGDLVTREPTFRAIRLFFPKANITFLTSNIGKQLYEDSEYFDKIVVYKRFFDTVRKLKDRSYDVVFNIQCTKLSHFITLFLEKKILVNKSQTLFQKVFKIKTDAKSLKQMLSLGGIESKKLEDYFENKQNYISRLPYTPYDYRTENTIIGICTGSSKRWQSKKWGIKKYSMLIRKLLECGFEIFLVGSHLEKEDEKILKSSGLDVISFVDKVSIKELKGVLQRVDVFVGNDSGPAHIAAGVGTKTLTIFGPTDIKHSPKFEKYASSHMFVKPKSSIKCHPCYKGVCPTKLECLQSIEVDEVFALVLDLLKGSK